jgi:hypothetical protein
MPELNNRIIHLDIPERMKGLSISDEGYPVPWFVPWVDGKPEFRGMDGEKLGIAVRHDKCWLCGQTLGVYKVFPIGPMCCVTRTISEPPSHKECALYGVKACPFLTQPRMRRNEKDMPEHGHIAGIPIKRNPGVTCLWTTKHYKVIKAFNGGILFRIGSPERVEFWSQGRRATREEALGSMKSGLPILMMEAEKDGLGAVQELGAMYDKAVALCVTHTDGG